MGEIADDMIDGLVCEECGKYLPGTPPGHPRLCFECEEQLFEDDEQDV